MQQQCVSNLKHKSRNMEYHESCCSMCEPRSHCHAFKDVELHVHTHTCMHARKQLSKRTNAHNVLAPTSHRLLIKTCFSCGCCTHCCAPVNSTNHHTQQLVSYTPWAAYKLNASSTSFPSKQPARNRQTQVRTHGCMRTVLTLYECTHQSMGKINYQAL